MIQSNSARDTGASAMTGKQYVGRVKIVEISQLANNNCLGTSLGI